MYKLGKPLRIATITAPGSRTAFTDEFSLKAAGIAFPSASKGLRLQTRTEGTSPPEIRLKTEPGGDYISSIKMGITTDARHVIDLPFFNGETVDDLFVGVGGTASQVIEIIY